MEGEIEERGEGGTEGDNKISNTNSYPDTIIVYRYGEGRVIQVGVCTHTTRLSTLAVHSHIP